MRPDCGVLRRVHRWTLRRTRCRAGGAASPSSTRQRHRHPMRRGARRSCRSLRDPVGSTTTGKRERLPPTVKFGDQDRARASGDSLVPPTAPALDTAGGEVGLEHGCVRRFPGCGVYLSECVPIAHIGQSNHDHLVSLGGRCDGWRSLSSQVILSKVQVGPLAVASLASQVINTASSRSAKAT